MTCFNRFRWTSNRSDNSSKTAYIDFVGLASAVPTALESGTKVPRFALLHCGIHRAHQKATMNQGATLRIVVLWHPSRPSENNNG